MSLTSTLKATVKPALVSLASHFGPHATTSKAPKLWILMYHRVLPQTDARFAQEEPGMLMQPETFAMHIQEIKKHFDLMSLTAWTEAKLNGGTLPAKACAITFDDGWLDNYEFAFPALQAEAAPATLFAVAGKIGTDFQFWPNIVAHLLLNGATAKLAKQAVFHDALSGTSTHRKPSADEIANIIRRLKNKTDEDIFNALNELSWRELCHTSMAPALMSWKQLKTMQQSGLVDIGSHTCNHRRLTNALSQAQLTHEIADSKQILQEKLNVPIDLFCFPNGDYNPAALALVQANYKAAVTTQRGINSAQANLHELTRVALHDEVSKSRTLFRARLSGWM